MRKKRKIRKVRLDRDDAPELTAAWFKRARPAREVDPELVAAYNNGTLRYRGQRGAQKSPTKVQVSIRLSREVLKHFKGKGAGWQSRIDRLLMAHVDAGK